MKVLLFILIFMLSILGPLQASNVSLKASHAVSLLKSFEADKVDSVINSKVTRTQCSVSSEDSFEFNNRPSNSRAPAIVIGKKSFESFKKAVAQGRFADPINPEGDIYLYKSEMIKDIKLGELEKLQVTESEFVFLRKSGTSEQPFEHELGLTQEQVIESLSRILEKTDSHYQSSENSFAVQIGTKLYFIDLEKPLMANPIYKQDVTTARIEYGLSGIFARKNNLDKPFVTMNK